MVPQPAIVPAPTWSERPKEIIAKALEDEFALYGGEAFAERVLEALRAENYTVVWQSKACNGADGDNSNEPDTA